jgi:hypothetical protein
MQWVLDHHITNDIYRPDCPRMAEQIVDRALPDPPMVMELDMHLSE